MSRASSTFSPITSGKFVNMCHDLEHFPFFYSSNAKRTFSPIASEHTGMPQHLAVATVIMNLTMLNQLITVDFGLMMRSLAFIA